MTTPIPRAEILRRLRAQISDGYPILVATAGNGLIARSLEAGHVDLLLTSVTGVSRQMGLPSIGWRMDENNEVVLEIIKEVSAVLRHETPVVASVAAGEPTADADLGKILGEFVAAGYSGILNYPTVGGRVAEGATLHHAEYLERAEQPDATDYAKRVAAAIRSSRRQDEEKIATGRGFEREIEMITRAHEMDVFTMAYAWSPEQSVQMVEAGADVLIGHCGGTAGGAAGDALVTHEEAAAWLRQILEPAADASSDVILMGHGGPFATPADTRLLYDLTPAVGFLGGSAVERIPVEQAVRSTVEEFRGVPLTHSVTGSV